MPRNDSLVRAATVAMATLESTDSLVRAATATLGGYPDHSYQDRFRLC
jgi:hypothetical protein